MQESWRVVPELPMYEVSNFGNGRRTLTLKDGTKIVRPIKAHVVKPRGYCRFMMYSENKNHQYFVHSIVLRLFVGPRPKRMDVNHKDGNKQNNRVDNLEYISRSENHRHAYTLGLHSREHPPKLSWKKVKEIRLLHSRGISQLKLALLFDVTHSQINLIVNNKSWVKKPAKKRKAA